MVCVSNHLDVEFAGQSELTAEALCMVAFATTGASNGDLTAAVATAEKKVVLISLTSKYAIDIPFGDISNLVPFTVHQNEPSAARQLLVGESRRSGCCIIDVEKVKMIKYLPDVTKMELFDFLNLGFPQLRFTFKSQPCLITDLMKDYTLGGGSVISEVLQPQWHLLQNSSDHARFGGHVRKIRSELGPDSDSAGMTAAWTALQVQRNYAFESVCNLKKQLSEKHSVIELNRQILLNRLYRQPIQAAYIPLDMVRVGNKPPIKNKPLSMHCTHIVAGPLRVGGGAARQGLKLISGKCCCWAVMDNTGRGTLSRFEVLPYCSGSVGNLEYSFRILQLPQESSAVGSTEKKNCSVPLLKDVAEIGPGSKALLIVVFALTSFTHHSSIGCSVRYKVQHVEGTSSSANGTDSQWLFTNCVLVASDPFQEKANSTCELLMSSDNNYLTSHAYFLMMHLALIPAHLCLLVNKSAYSSNPISPRTLLSDAMDSLKFRPCIFEACWFHGGYDNNLSSLDSGILVYIWHGCDSKILDEHLEFCICARDVSQIIVTVQHLSSFFSNRAVILPAGAKLKSVIDHKVMVPDVAGTRDILSEMEVDSVDDDDKVPEFELDSPREKRPRTSDASSDLCRTLVSDCKLSLLAEMDFAINSLERLKDAVANRTISYRTFRADLGSLESHTDELFFKLR